MTELALAIFDLIATVVFMICVIVALTRLTKRIARLESMFYTPEPPENTKFAEPFVFGGDGVPR